MATDGSDLQQVTAAPSSDTDASWSPDGDRIVYSSDYAELLEANIYVISATGGVPIRVTNNDTYDGAPSWSPDGKWIAFESPGNQEEDSPTALWRIALPERGCDEEACIYLPLTLSNTTGSSSGWWQPDVDTSWQWQLTESLDQSFDVAMYDIDLFDNDASAVAALHAQGRKVICYISVGSWEDWRSDADQFPASVLGNDYEGWEGEKWLDIRQIDLLAPIMRARFDECKAKGFDGISNSRFGF